MRRRLIGLAVVLLISWGGLAVSSYFGIHPRLGLDLQGGTSVVLTAPASTPPDVLAQAVEQMRARIEDLGGVQEPEISISGGSTVLVQLPGVVDSAKALEVIGQTGQLSFRPVLAESFTSESPLLTPTTTTTVSVSTTTIAVPVSSTSVPSVPAQPTSTTLPAVSTTAGTTITQPATTTTASDSTTTTTFPPTTTTLPPGVDSDGFTIEDDPNTEAWLPELDDTGARIDGYHVGPARLVGSDIKEAAAVFDTSQGVWAVSLDLTADGGAKFARLTKEAAQFPGGGLGGDPRRKIAIVLDGVVLTAPSVQDDVDPATGITGGSALITLGSSTNAETEARNLAVVLRYGALPVAFEQSQVERVSATLGSDSLRSGVVAGIVGMVLVGIGLLIYYRAMGLVALIGLAVFGTLLIGSFSWLGRSSGLTLTLAGVTGVIVSIGIAADSYVVFFERIKEEIRAGRTIRSAAEEGFRRAFRTIITADTVSLLAALLLFLLAVGPVKGFALSLGIATVLDIVVSRVFSRRAIWLLAHSPLAEKGRFSIRAATGRVAT